MKIIFDRPPNYDKINAAFNIEGKPVIIAYGDYIYNPLGGKITKSLIEHEFIHCAQQGGGSEETMIEMWWDQYIADPHFRYLQELQAHAAEWRHYAKRHPGKRAAQYLDHVATKLSSELYGNLVTREKAAEAIMTGHHP